MAKEAPEFLVKKEHILELFDPPPGDTTFSNWVRDGKIIQSEAPTWYLLNETRMNLGLPPVSEKPDSQEELLSQKVLVQLALHVCLPKLMLLPSELLDRWISWDEFMEVRKYVRMFNHDLEDMETNEDKLEYAQDVMDGLYIGQKERRK